MLVDRRMRYIFHRPDDYVPVVRRQVLDFDLEDRLSSMASNSGETEDMESNSRKRKIESDDDDVVSVKSEIPKSLCSIDEDKTTYGLKQDYLKSLGITPPIGKWVHVANFRCDKSELKEVLDLAGQVLQCSIIYNLRGRYARVMYTHPLEAVQAVSMLNGQIFYGQKLQVTMTSSISNALVILPKGLSNIGPGLGMHGRPLRDVVKQYKKLQRNMNSNIDASIFRNGDYKEDDCNSENASNDDAYSNKSSNRRPFKITNVEDLPDDESVTENKSKKPKRDSENNSVTSDQESEDGELEQSNINDEETRQIETVAPRRVPRIKDNSNFAGAETPRPPFTPQNVPSPQPISMVCTGPQVRPVPPPLRGICPPPPAIGPLAQSGSMSPFAPTVRPLGPPTSTIGPPFRNCPPARSVAAMAIPGAHGRMPMPAPAHGGAPGPCPPEAHMASSPRLPGPMQGPPFPTALPLRPNIMPNPHIGPRPMVGGNGPPNQPVTLEFRNLPPTTTFQLLSEKVSQCGPVLSLQLTTPGCAIARFPHRAHADRCFQFFHGKFIDGCVIEARYAS